MQTREYGRTGKHVSIIGFGGMRFTDDDDESVRAILRASELGINYFDTAPHYCRDRSEDIFGKAFASFTRPFYVSTKSSIGDEKNADEVRRRAELSLKRLGVSKIHFFHMWCIMNWDHFQKVIAPGGPYDGAAILKKEGLIDHIVFSTHANGDEIRRMCETNRFEGVLLGYNLFNHSNRFDGILAAQENTMGVAVMNPLGGGMIPAAQSQLQFLPEHDDETVVQAALRFVVSEPGVTLALVGMSTVAQVEENAKVGDRITRPDPERVARIKRKYGEFGEAYCTACKYCLPCPAQINIPNLLSCLNRQRVGLEKEAGMFYEFFKKTGKTDFIPASACADCGICEERCTQHLPIRAQLREVTRLFESDNQSQ
ncbi:aldo/keto reductase [bacterium]|nr:aldo/keto reductase [candidate division CSSED10-310 bacterium]